MGGFVYDLVANRLSLEETARLSTNDQTYFRALVDRKLASREPQPRVVDDALQDQATIVFQYLNELFDKPDTVRFRIIEPLTARELYTVLAYGEENAISTSYHGAFTRLLARMRQEGLTGEHLLAQVNEVRLRPFIKSAAKVHHLEAFFATMPSLPARSAVLTRCFSGLERTPDMAVQAAHAAEILDTAADGQGSFRNFMAQYRAAPAWRVEDYGTFVRMTSSGANRRIILYANKPTDDGERATELDRWGAFRGGRCQWRGFGT